MQTKKARFNSIEMGDLPNQYLPKQRWPAARDRKHLFYRNRPSMSALMTVFIINRVIHDQVANISSIDKKAEIYRHGKKEPVILIDDQKPRTRR